MSTAFLRKICDARGLPNAAFILLQGDFPMKKSIRFLDANILRGLACILMLCDHMWATIIPGNEWMTWVGRLAFPIFAFQIAEGYLHTSNFRNYAVRLLLFGLISEIPFDLVYGSTIFYPFHQNVMFTLLFGLLAIKALDNARQKRTGKAWIAGILLAALCCLAASVIFTDYGALGVATVIMFYLCRDFRFAWAAQLALMILFNLVLFTGEYIPLTIGSHVFEIQTQGFAVFGLIPIWLYNGKKGISNKALQYGFYAFYPVHLLVLYLLFTYAV